MSTAELIPKVNARADESANKPQARKYLPYLLFAMCVSLYFLPFMRLLLFGTDEGTLVSGAVRVAHGQLLGRDFFEVIGPGTFYWLAFFFKLFGVTFMASRICLFVSSMGTALSLYFLSRRLCRSYQLLPCLVVFATYFSAVWPTISHHVDSNCFALLAVACMTLWQDSGKRRLLVAAGLLVGATTLTLQPKGLLLLLAFLLWLWIQHRRESIPFTALVWVMGASVSVVVLMLSYFWKQNALASLIYANVIWPFRNYDSVNSVYYASGLLKTFSHWVVVGHGTNWTMGMASVLVIPFFFIAALPALLPLLAAREIKAMKSEIVLYWLAGYALWLSELHRKDMTHLVCGSPLLVIVCIFYLQKRQNKRFDLALQTLSITSACLAACTLILALFAHSTETRVGQVGVTAYDPLLAEIDERVPSGGDLFVYPYSPMYYFLSSTNNPTRYSILLNNYNTDTQFEEVTRTLDQHKVRYVLWDKSLEDRIISAQFPSARPRHFIMEPYLESHYRPVWNRDGVLLMERNNDNYN